MRFVYVLEDDPKFQRDVVEALASIDPKLQIRLFPKLETFVEWIRLMMTTGPDAIAQGGLIPSFVTQEPVAEKEAHQLVCVVSKIEYLGVHQLGLLKKTKGLFIERNICTKEDPTSFVLTAFDDPNFDIRQLEDRVLSNLIFKPFDRLILTQHLIFAVDGRHPASKSTIINQKTSSQVEMLKDVHLEALSDVGIVTKSNREIKIGSVAKYYGQTFMSDRHRSLFAICQQCIPHPMEPELFRCTFTFLAADQTQISNLRKRARDKNGKEFAFDWKNLTTASSTKELNVILLDEEEHGPSGLQGAIEKRFESVKVMNYDSFGAFMGDLDPNQAMGERDPNLKALGGANSVTLHFDVGGVTYLGLESDKKDLAMIFNTSESDLKTKSNWFSHAVVAEHKDKYRKYVQTLKLVEDNILPLQMGEHTFLVRVMDLKKDAGKFHITLTEPGKDEQVKWLQANSKLKIPVHLIIASHRLFGEGAKERWGFVKESLKKKFNIEPLLIVTTKKDFTDSEERSFGSYVQDIFFKPVDKVYFTAKMKTMFPKLMEKSEKVDIKTVVLEETIKAVNPVKVIEISEAGFVMTYYRSLSIGSFREIVLWQPYEIGAPELLATCNFVEENAAEKGTFNCHFVFFGINDHFLKHIRVWIRDNYVLSKEGQAS